MRFTDRITAVDGTTAKETPLRADVQPLSSTENVVAGQQVITRYRVFLPAHTTLGPTGRVKWDGLTYQVEGDVEVHKINGRTHHKEAVLSRVTG